MCGIVGAIGHVDEKVGESLARMHVQQRHRGPDDEGTWSKRLDNEGCEVHFLFRRLAIIDISAAGHQPMADAATGNVVIFNGELYNFKELRAEIERTGVVFATESDTEVLLKSYAMWGVECLSRLRGMFAFALWDNERRHVVLARDRLGIKPLYYCTVARPNNGQLTVFASELRTIMVSGLTAKALNTRAVSAYVWNGFVPGEQTIIRDVWQLLPGHVAVLRQDATMTRRRYWQYPAYEPVENGVEELQEALQTSIRQHLVSDVPLGIFLSGGIDSSAVAALAAQKAPAGGLATYNLSFDETKLDEPRIARAVAAALGASHKEVRLSQKLFRAQLEDALSSIDQPTFDGINTYFISRAVREAGLTVALAGTGGDELFGGYRSFSEIPKARLVSQAMSKLPDVVLQGLGRIISGLANGRSGGLGPQTRWGKVADVLRKRGSVVGLYQTSYSLFTQAFHDQLVEEPLELTHGLPVEMFDLLREISTGKEILHTISLMELVCFIGERLLRDTDAASMAVSLEVRVPLLDHCVVESSALVDKRRRFYPVGKKQLLRDVALAGLDPKLFDRPKTGFGLPIEFWSRQSLQSDLEAIFDDTELCREVGLDPVAVGLLWSAFKAKAPGIHWSRIWAIFILLWWCRRHEVRR